MFGYVLLVILVTAGVTLVESFLIAFVAGLLGIGVSFKVIFFVMFVINFFVGGGSSKQMKDSTRAKSSKQEKRIAKAIGGRQVVGSGSTPFLKGDVVVDKLFIEAKTKMNPSQSITVKKSWIDKAKEQSLAMRKSDYAIAVSFGDPKDYYLIEDSFMEELLKAREAVKQVQEIPFEDILNGAVGDIELGWNRAIDKVRRTIEEVYE